MCIRHTATDKCFGGTWQQSGTAKLLQPYPILRASLFYHMNFFGLIHWVRTYRTVGHTTVFYLQWRRNMHSDRLAWWNLTAQSGTTTSHQPYASLRTDGCEPFVVPCYSDAYSGDDSGAYSFYPGSVTWRNLTAVRYRNATLPTDYPLTTLCQLPGAD